MSDDKTTNSPEAQAVSFKDLAAETLRSLIYEMSFSEYIEKVRTGLQAPHDSGEYRYAKQQVLRLWAPVSGVAVPLIGLIVLLLLPQRVVEESRVVDIQVVEPSKVELEPEPIKEPEKPEIVEQVDVPPDIPTTVPTLSDSMAPGPPGAGVGPNIPFSPVPSSHDTVAIVRSPIKMKGIYGSRNPGSRGSALGRYGGGTWTEDAVLKALRWLKKNQSSDGSWPQTKPAMTGFALLTFLAHGEKPDSEEFGYTVERAIQFLISAQQADGHFAGKDGNDYSHPIATYALCEAYGLTKVPQIKEAAQKALKCIVQGIHASGGFNYKLDNSERDDTSYMAWCAQAMKAGDFAYVMDEPEKLRAAMRKAVDGFKKNYSAGGGGGGDSAYAQGGFGYTSPGVSGLTGAGTLCMQLLGAAKEKEVRSSLETMKGWTFSWEDKGYGSCIYYAYYSTQAKFHEGGDQWTAWNKQFSPALCKSQTVISKAIEDTKGKLVDIGYWDCATSGHSDGGEGKRVMTTCLCTLMLEVYYRYLPTFQKPADEIVVDGGAPGANNKKENEVKIDVGGI